MRGQHSRGPETRSTSARMVPVDADSPASRTALGAARHRAVHQLLEGGSILDDPLAVRVTGDDPDDLVARARERGDHRMRWFVCARSRFAEQVLADAVRGGGRPARRPRRRASTPSPTATRTPACGSSRWTIRPPGPGSSSAWPRPGSRCRPTSSHAAGRLRAAGPRSRCCAVGRRPRPAGAVLVARRDAVPHRAGRRDDAATARLAALVGGRPRPRDAAGRRRGDDRADASAPRGGGTARRALGQRVRLPGARRARAAGPASPR